MLEDLNFNEILRLLFFTCEEDDLVVIQKVSGHYEYSVIKNDTVLPFNAISYIRTSMDRTAITEILEDWTDLNHTKYRIKDDNAIKDLYEPIAYNVNINPNKMTYEEALRVSYLAGDLEDFLPFVKKEILSNYLAHA